MPHDEKQRQLFDSLSRDAGLTAKELDFMLRCGQRQAYRIMAGSSPLTLAQIRRLIVHGGPKIADPLSDHIHDGAGRISIQFDADAAPLVDATAAQVLQELADFFTHRETHRRDGVITETERDREREQVARAIRVLHQLHLAVSNQRAARPATQPEMKLAGGAA